MYKTNTIEEKQINKYLPNIITFSKFNNLEIL